MCQGESLPESTEKWYVVIRVQLFLWVEAEG